MNDERTDFEVALDDLLQVARHAPRTGEGYQEIQAARRTFLSVFAPPAPGEVRLTDEQKSCMANAIRPYLADKYNGPGKAFAVIGIAIDALAAAAAPERT